MSDVLVNGIRLSYQVHGDGPPLVLAHGYRATLDMSSSRSAPSSEKYRVVVFVSAATSRSETPRDWSSRRSTTGRRAQRQLIDHLGVDSAYVGGLSMGGMMAHQFALTYPERLGALLSAHRREQPPHGGIAGTRSEGAVAAATAGSSSATPSPAHLAVGRYLPLQVLPAIRKAPEGIKSYVRGYSDTRPRPGRIGTPS